MSTRVIWASILLLSAMLPAAAASYSAPMGNTLMMTQHTSRATQKMADQIMEKVGLGYSGYIQLEWRDSAWTSAAWQLRRALLVKGFSSSHILLWHEDRNSKMLSPKAWRNVNFLSVVPHVKSCRANPMDYRYRKSDNMGCAVEQMRNASLLNNPADLE